MNFAVNGRLEADGVAMYKCGYGERCADPNFHREPDEDRQRARYLAHRAIPGVRVQRNGGPRYRERPKPFAEARHGGCGIADPSCRSSGYALALASGPSIRSDPEAVRGVACRRARDASGGSGISRSCRARRLKRSWLNQSRSSSVICASKALSRLAGLLRIRCLPLPCGSRSCAYEIAS